MSHPSSAYSVSLSRDRKLTSLTLDKQSTGRSPRSKNFTIEELKSWRCGWGGPLSRNPSTNYYDLLASLGSDSKLRATCNVGEYVGEDGDNVHVTRTRRQTGAYYRPVNLELESWHDRWQHRT